MQRLTVLIVVALGLLLAFVGCGGGTRPATGTVAEDTATLGWPPAAPQRLASAYAESLIGSEFTARGGNTALMSDDLFFVGEGITPWAVFSFGDLSEDNELVSVASDFVLIPDEDGDGTELYFAVANYHTDTWQWITAPTAGSPWICPPANADFYRDADGWAHLAVVLAGPGAARLRTVTFDHETNMDRVDPPQNLVATVPALHEVHLDWDDVTDAESYNVYRSTDKFFMSQVKVNTAPVTTSEYVDTVMTDGNYYFYHATAVAAQESAHSNTARAWVYGDDLPAPTNLQVSARTTDSFTVSWEWDGPSGGNLGFRLFIDTVPDFTMYSETMTEHTTFGFARENTFHDLQPGVSYFVKMCAYDGIGAPCGRIMDEVTGSCSGYWTWAEPEVIASGRAPVRMVNGDGNLALSFFTSVNVMFAIKDGGEWRVEAALANETDYFMDYQDLCYGGGSYLVTTHSSEPGDCWVSVWDTADGPGAWAPYRVDGNGIASLGALYSGYHATCTASDTEFAVAHFQVNDRSMKLHTRAIDGGAWTTQSYPNLFGSGGTPAFSLCYQGGDLAVIWTESTRPELFFSTRADGWDWVNIQPATPIKLPSYHDLKWFRDEFWTPGHNPADKDLYVAHGTAAPWTLNRLDYDGNCGYYARMDVEGDDAAVIQFRDNQFHFALYSETWDWQPVSVPGITSYDGKGDVVLLDGVPYIAFRDNSGYIQLTYGIPPEE